MFFSARVARIAIRGQGPTLVDCKFPMLENPDKVEQLFRQCAAGSASDCDDFFRLMRPIFRRVVGRIALQFSAPDDIDDIMQEVSLRISADLDRVTQLLPLDPATVPSYFAVIAANGARDWFRSRGAQKRGRRVTSALDDSAHRVSQQLGLPPEQSILIQQIESAIEANSRERTIFRLYYQQGYSAREIAAIPALALSTKGVESLISRLVRQLQEKLRVPEGNPARNSSKDAGHA